MDAFSRLPLAVAQLSLPAVLACGQSFRWSVFHPPSSFSGLPEYRLCLRDRVVCLRQSDDTLYYRSVFPDPQPCASTRPARDAETLNWINDYFQLSIDLVALYKQWATADSVFASFQDRFQGIRMLRQDPWENLISFICSSNNNISRITSMVHNLCKHYSPPLLSLANPFDPTQMLDYHPFPYPSALAPGHVSTHLRSLSFGYRADYIQRTAKMLVDAHGTSSPSSLARESSEIWLSTLRNLETVAAREELLKFVGVGRKVADCILLMSLDKKEVVPVDTHVYQIAVKYYGQKAPAGGKAAMSPKLHDDLNAKFFSIWGHYAGWAHSVLFTADLKSFADYGLEASPKKKNISPSKKVKESKTALPTPPETPTPLAKSLAKRKFSEDDGDVPSGSLTPVSQLCTSTEAQLSIVDRVKRRRKQL